MLCSVHGFHRNVKVVILMYTSCLFSWVFWKLQDFLVQFQWEVLCNTVSTSGFLARFFHEFHITASVSRAALPVFRWANIYSLFSDSGLVSLFLSHIAQKQRCEEATEGCTTNKILDPGFESQISPSSVLLSLNCKGINILLVCFLSQVCPLKVSTYFWNSITTCFGWRLKHGPMIDILCSKLPSDLTIMRHWRIWGLVLTNVSVNIRFHFQPTMHRCRTVYSENDHYREPLLSSLWPLVSDPPVHACWHSLIERDRESGATCSRETSLWCACTTVSDSFSCSVSSVINSLAGQVGLWWNHILICC